MKNKHSNTKGQPHAHYSQRHNLGFHASNRYDARYDRAQARQHAINEKALGKNVVQDVAQTQLILTAMQMHPTLTMPFIMAVSASMSFNAAIESAAISYGCY